ncbi:MAG TPA: hypothetical protein VLJ83_01055 [Gemmatimonadaceae bacterium]|nr:hypothetical protein [Gemmatimonadaceae bacterium]
MVFTKTIAFDPKQGIDRCFVTVSANWEAGTYSAEGSDTLHTYDTRYQLQVKNAPGPMGGLLFAVSILDHIKCRQRIPWSFQYEVSPDYYDIIQAASLYVLESWWRPC